MAGSLTRDDVNRLLQDPSAGNRAALAPKLAEEFDQETLSEGEYALAQDILQILARDAAIIVRKALSINLKSSRHLPRDVAKALARDIDEIALPILETSEVFTDDDLVELVRDVPEAKQIAIARRQSLSEQVTDALVATDNRGVVRTVVSNNGARLTEQTLNKVVDRFGDLEEIQEPLAYRAHLPLTVAERLVARVSDHLKDYLVAHHELTGDTATEIIMQARERATMNLIGPMEDADSVEKLVNQLATNKRLTPTLVFRALCMGDIKFFESAMSRLSGVSLINTRMLIHDRGPLGLRSLYEHAGLPDRLFPAMRVAVSVLLETDPRDRDYDRESFGRTMLERILSTADDLHPEDADYLLRKLDDIGMTDEDADTPTAA